MKARAYLILGHVRSKTRSLGQIVEKACVHSRGQCFVSNSCILFESGSCCIKNKVVRAKLSKKSCVHSRGHSFEPNFMKLSQNVNPYAISVTFVTGLCWIKN